MATQPQSENTTHNKRVAIALKDVDQAIWRVMRGMAMIDGIEMNVFIENLIKKEAEARGIPTNTK